MNGLPPAALSLDGRRHERIERSGAAVGGRVSGLQHHQRASARKRSSRSRSARASPPAEYGGTMSGNVNIITSGGSNNCARQPVLEPSARRLRREQSVRLDHAREAPQSGRRIVRRPGACATRCSSSSTTKASAPIARTSSRGDVPTPEFRAQAIAAQPAYRALMDLYPLPNQPYASGATNGRFISLRPFTRNDDRVHGAHGLSDVVGQPHRTAAIRRASRSASMRAWSRPTRGLVGREQLRHAGVHARRGFVGVGIALRVEPGEHRAHSTRRSTRACRTAPSAA